MSRWPVALGPGAEEDAREAFLWYRSRSPFAASRFRAELFELLDRLGETAASWPADEDGLRRVLLRRFPFTVVFELSATGVTVLAVAHHRRRPGYWRSS